MHPPMDPDVSIVVVSWNTRDLTLACLESVRRATTKKSYELIVVDNASSDGTAAAIAEHAPFATLLAQEENLGFARACNLGASTARGGKILFLNPATLILDGAIDRLAEFAACTPDARIWGGRTLFPDLSLSPTSCRNRMTPWNQLCNLIGLSQFFPRSDTFNGEAIGGWNRDTVRYVDIVSGSFMMVDRFLWRELGGFDASLYMYGEDADLCLRAAKLGATPLFTPTAEIIHYGNASKQTPAGQVVKQLTAKATLIRKHWSPGSQWFGRFLLRTLPRTRWLITTVLSKLNRSAYHKDQAAIWSKVLAEKKSWSTGYRTRTNIPTWVSSGNTREATAITQTQPQILKAG